MTKAQLRVIRHMFVAKTYLKSRSDGNWRYSNGDDTLVRKSTVNALMRGGLITPGFDASSLTAAVIQEAKNTE